MARTSRKEKSIEIRKKPSGRIWKTAIYARISNRDQNSNPDTLPSQVEFVRMNLDRYEGLDLVKIYTDNGYTGRNFDRPGFQEMLKDLSEETINCIIVKDFSRFGRNMAGTGFYLENFFPRAGIRFISVNDHYDSANEKHQDSLIVPIKDLLNEMYSRDLAKKVNKTFRERKNHGELVSAVPYGYKKGSDRKIVVDTEVADFVRYMFQWRKEGLCEKAIAEKMDLLEAEKPICRKLQLGYLKRRPKNLKTNWTAEEVHNILMNPIYAGVMAYQRYNYRPGRKGTTSMKPREEWDIRKASHEPIITMKLFDEVYDLCTEEKKARNEKRQADDEKKSRLSSVLSEFVYCGTCGQRLTPRYVKYDGKYCFLNYSCGKKDCAGKTVIAERLLRILVLDQIRIQIKAGADLGLIRKKYACSREYMNRKTELERSIISARKGTEDLRENKMNAYEMLMTGELDRETYEVYTGDLEKKIKKVQMEEELLEKEYEELSDAMSAKHENMPELDPEDLGFSEDLIRAIINRIFLYEDGHIQIEYVFQDQLERLGFVKKELGIDIDLRENQEEAT